MRQGRAALGLKQYADALGSFQKAQDLLPGDAASAELIRDVSKQKTEADTATAARQKGAEVNQAIADARAALRANKFDEAKVATDKVLKLDPDNAIAKKLAADIDEGRKAYAAAVQKKDDAKKSAKVDELLARARRAIQAKDLDGAAKFLADAAAVDATDPDVKKVQAEYDAARRQTAATDTDAKQKQAAYLQALRDASTAYAAKKYDVAIREAKEALANKPGDPAATKILADAQKAQEAANTAATEAAKNREAYDAAIKAGRTAYSGRKFDEAVKAFTDALKAIPGDPTATQYLNAAKKAAVTADAAATEAQKKKDAYDAAMKAGRTAMARKDYDDAIKAFNDALKADPGDPTATALLKQAKDAQGDTAADAKKKQLYEAWMAQANKMMASRNYDEAADAFSRALRVIPGDPTATKGLAEARAAMSKKDPPKVEPKPKDPPKVEPKPKGDPNAAKVAALLKQAGGEEDAGKYADAYQTYQDVLAIAPANAEAKKRSTFCQWMDQGKRQLAGGKLSEAASSFEQALKIDPNDANAKKLLQQAKPKKK
jgi:YD repeat-containing protein